MIPTDEVTEAIRRSFAADERDPLPPREQCYLAESSFNALKNLIALQPDSNPKPLDLRLDFLVAAVYYILPRLPVLKIGVPGCNKYLLIPSIVIVPVGRETGSSSVASTF
eukprot:scaffold12293_cov154-Skeletonema_menzelii.AAC.3